MKSSRVRSALIAFLAALVALAAAGPIGIALREGTDGKTLPEDVRGRLYGSGWSARDDDLAFGLPLWADQLAGVLDALGLDRASVAGHTMGGAAAAVFAARHPSRIDKLILADSLYPQEDDEIPLTFRALRTP